MSLNKEILTNPVVKAAITALENGDLEQWNDLFTGSAELYDDGNKTDLAKFSKQAIGHERFTAIDKIENNGLALYGRFHSDKWGNFKPCFKFHISAEGRIYRLDIGQANY
jgi:hypothetical protein